jgi:hypothetical protein
MKELLEVIRQIENGSKTIGIKDQLMRILKGTKEVNTTNNNNY